MRPLKTTMVVQGGASRPNAFGGSRIIAAGEPAASVFFLQSGMVSVKLTNGTRLASLVPAWRRAGERIMHNFATLLARRPAQANLRIDLLSAR